MIDVQGLRIIAESIGRRLSPFRRNFGVDRRSAPDRVIAGQRPDAETGETIFQLQSKAVAGAQLPTVSFFRSHPSFPTHDGLGGNSGWANSSRPVSPSCSQRGGGWFSPNRASVPVYQGNHGRIRGTTRWVSVEINFSFAPHLDNGYFAR